MYIWKLMTWEDGRVAKICIITAYVLCMFTRKA
jgi:hypothetical protein